MISTRELKTPTRRFAPTPDQVRGRLSPFQGEVRQAAHHCLEAQRRARGSLFPPPERGRDRVGVMR
jgi:hypothetical protein